MTRPPSPSSPSSWPPGPAPRPAAGRQRRAGQPALGGAAALLASLAVHAAAATGAIWWGLGRPHAQPPRLEVAPEAPRLVAVLPALEREPEPEAEPERWLELLPPPEATPPAPEDDLPEVLLEPEVEAPEPLPRAQPLTLPADELARAGRRVRPPAQASPAAAPEPARSPAPPAPRPPRAALVGRTLPTPTWPAGLAGQPAGAVVLLFFVRADGTLADVRVESGSGLPLLDEHVRAFVARTWSFEPTGEPRWARNRFVVGAPR